MASAESRSAFSSITAVVVMVSSGWLVPAGRSDSRGDTGQFSAAIRPLGSKSLRVPVGPPVRTTARPAGRGPGAQVRVGYGGHGQGCADLRRLRPEFTAEHEES
ncbi:hypothetical protein GCM10023175_69560 [Pseudonocardia xishanensis]|uniref:Secreted protein n=1 Tax=Pseudonocardia xishanensis TaxID=630995 RepID=A0ABP8S340_9PSEU